MIVSITISFWLVVKKVEFKATSNAMHEFPSKFKQILECNLQKRKYYVYETFGNYLPLSFISFSLPILIGIVLPFGGGISSVWHTFMNTFSPDWLNVLMHNPITMLT